LIQLEYIPPFYQKYLSRVGDRDVLTLLKKDLDETGDFLHKIPESKQNFSYRAGKWTIQQIILHLMDVERIFIYRAHRFSRNDPTELAGFDQDSYIDQVKTGSINFEMLLKGWENLRRSSILFYELLPGDALKRTGRAMGLEFTPESIGYILVGHTKHHISIIKEKYL
jgi:hypothetical protein